jgi:ribosomal protein S18 acetylase RimI-like enzyme
MTGPSQAKPLIRFLVAADLPAYKALRDSALLDYPEAFTSDYASERLREASSYLPRLAQAGQFDRGLWGAFDQSGRLLGSIAIEAGARLQQRHIGTVLGLFVDRAAQGQGVATLLIASCADAARAGGQFDQLILTVTASNTHVVRLYERAGFVRYGLLQRAIGVQGVYHDKLLMRLPLHP